MKAEERVISNIEKMLNLSLHACELLRKAVLEKNDLFLEEISRIERDGDDLRRNTAKEIYKGAFLPYLRMNILRLVENVDDILNTIDKAGKYFKKIDDFEFLTSATEIERMMDLNILLCRVLSKNFVEFFKSHRKLDEAVIVVRMLEKEADNLKHSILESLREKNLDLWNGIFTFNFIESLEEISDVVEHMMDTVQVIVLSF